MNGLKYFLLCSIMGLFACRQSAIEEYNSLVKKELDSKKKVDDIFFGIRLGMNSKDFYVHCWNKNKEGLFRDGAGNSSVLYELDSTQLKHAAEMNFYPEFKNGQIHKLWAKFRYKGWMPWNKELGSDKLLPDIVELYGRWYPGGNPFIKIADEQRRARYVKIDGNRQIMITVFDDTDVKAEYTDLRISK
jgi:hypothetical protein